MLDLFRELQVLGQTLNFTKAANLLHMSPIEPHAPYREP